MLPRDNYQERERRVVISTPFQKCIVITHTTSRKP